VRLSNAEHYRFKTFAAAEVETVLRSRPGVLEVAAVLVPDDVSARRSTFVADIG
jgi:acyl-coenzyme A synthetase/AMP-(fatty) acid ligase